MSKRSKPAKIEDVAAKAKVSIMSVSRALRGVEGVSEKKRVEILKIARKLKYVPNSNARSLAVANSNLIGISLPTFAGEVFAEILNGMRQTFDKSGYSSVIDTTQYSKDAELDWVKRLITWQPAAIILSGIDHHKETRDLLRAAPMPVLEIWDYSDDPIDICVGIDHFNAGQIIGDYAAHLGYRRPAFVGALKGYDNRADARLNGIREVFSHFGESQVIAQRRPFANPFSTGFDATNQLLEAKRPDVIFYLNDLMAFGGLMACQKHNVSVPNDIGLIGFNSLDLTEVLPVRLTTIKTPRRLMGVIGARNLLARINGVGVEKAIVLPVSLLEGETTRVQQS